MKNKKTSKILILLMIVTLLIPAFGSVAYAESDGDDSIAPMTIGSYVISFKAANSVRGDVDVYAHSIRISVIDHFQNHSAIGISWIRILFKRSGVSPSTYTVYNQPYIKHLCTFPITSSKNYRIKIEITDKVNGKGSTVTLYKTLTR